MGAGTLTLVSATNYGGGSVRPFCLLAGAFTPTTPVVQIDTFNTQGAGAAADALCASLTARALNADDVTCSKATVSGTTSLVALVTGRDGTVYECRATINNKNVCPRRTGGGGGGGRTDDDTDDDRKRFSPAQQVPCNTIRTFTQCTLGCNQNVLGACPCVWDNPNDASPFPSDMNEPCPVGQICCFNPPCSTWTTSDDCFFGSGGFIQVLPTDPPSQEANCEYINAGTVDAACVCRAPLVEVVLTPPSYSPFDCICPFGTNNRTTPSQCLNPADPTAAQLQQIRRFNLRFGQTASRASLTTFKRQCPKGRTRIQARGPRDNLAELVGKYVQGLREQALAFDIAWGKDKGKTYADITFFVDDGKKLRAVADSSFSAEELAGLDIQDAEAAVASATFATLSAAAVLVVAANQL